MKRVLLYSSRSLFAHGVKTLLDSEPDCEVIGWESDVEAAVKRVQELQPDVILVVNKGASDSPLSDGQRFLRAGKTAKIIELNSEDLNGCVYVGESLLIQEIGDLVKAIRNPLTAASQRRIRGQRASETKEKGTD